MSTPKKPFVSPHAVIEMAFPQLLGACDKWAESERLIATAVIESYLLEPTDGLRRLHSQHILLAAEIDQIEPLDEIEAAEKLNAPDLRTKLSIEISMLAKRSAATLQRALAFDANKAIRGKSKTKDAIGKRYGRAIREILTVGLIVMVMFNRVSNKSKKFSSDSAMELIHDEGKTNAMFVRDDKSMRAALREYGSVAHLAAALLQYLHDHDLSRFRSKQRAAWRSNIVEFLQNAAFYQNFITNTLPTLLLS
jgi:hypothetical protein